MFGQNNNNDNDQQNVDDGAQAAQTNVPSAADVGLADEGPAGTQQAPTDSPKDSFGGGTIQPTSAPEPATEDEDGSAEMPEPASTPPSSPPFSSASSVTPVVPAGDVGSGNLNDLLQIKQKALQHLSPLVDHIDQTPEEKFRTTMMMIQASDDQSLVKTAYEAAEKITDDKARAQALLDIVNEINYFSQQKHQN